MFPNNEEEPGYAPNDQPSVSGLPYLNQEYHYYDSRAEQSYVTLHAWEYFAYESQPGQFYGKPMYQLPVGGSHYGCQSSSSYHLQNHKSQNLVQDDASLVQTIKDKTSDSLQELSWKIEEPLNLSNRKNVTFGTNITTNEHVQEINNSTESLLERNEKGEAFPKSSQSTSIERCSDATNVGPYPPNYRYGNCLESDDEVEDSDSEDENDEDIEQDYDNDDGIICREVWCESIPVETDQVLKPVENLTQLKGLKSKGTITQSPSPQKENAITSIPFPHNNRNQEPSVDASLSNWLVSTEKSTSNNKQVGSFNPDPVSQESPSTTESIEDRPIFGALTVDELKQFSESTCTPRKSSSRSPDDKPIIGSVGSYWSQTGSAQSLSSVSSYKGIPNTTSKYREDKKVNWHNTPFETRLERVLNRDAATK
ncbi:uncharacterized protein LOC143612592 [Bidens hawaiensis]|uniref:uncharacterized protein LOC143612592 n=1 Tax=Bidens hawaiensis TaxID=980011 RepID=UPI00404A1839